MVRIPQYNRSVSPQNTPAGYVQANVSPTTFGAGVSQSMRDMGRAAGNTLDTLATLKANYDKAKLVEFSNFIDNWSN